MTESSARRHTLAPRASNESLVREDSSSEITYELLAFMLADEAYALPLRSIREILKVPAITEVPRAPRDILGIISVRGRVTTVFDLRRRLRMPEAPTTKQTRVLLVDQGDEILGVLVDAVLSVYRLRAEEVELAAVVAGDTAEYVMGVGRPKGARVFGRSPERSDQPDLESKDDILILLDPEPLLKR